MPHEVRESIDRIDEAEAVTLLTHQFMPGNGVGQMTDEELRALWMYLQSLPVLED